MILPLNFRAVKIVEHHYTPDQVRVFGFCPQLMHFGFVIVQLIMTHFKISCYCFSEAVFEYFKTYVEPDLKDNALSHITIYIWK